MEVNAATDTSSTASASAIATQQLTSDFDTFLQLLTAQVNNQDPLEPLDSTQFVEQLATFSALEQQINTNSQLETITGLLQGALGDESAALIGESARASTLTVDGNFAGIPIETTGDQVGQLVVRDSVGNEVFRSSSQSTNWSWDGTNNEGQPVAADTYSFQVVTADGTAVPAQAVGTIERVVTTDNGKEVGFAPNVSSSNFNV